jgi:hypothetical protein
MNFKIKKQIEASLGTKMAMRLCRKKAAIIVASSRFVETKRFCRNDEPRRDYDIIALCFVTF